MAKAYGGITITDTGGIVGQALTSKLKYIWINSEGTFAASGKEGFDTSEETTYEFNSWLSHRALKFRYDGIDLTSMGVDGIKIYAPKVTTSGNTESIIDSKEALRIDENGVSIKDISSGNIVAQYGATTIIGNKNNNKGYIEITNEGINFGQGNTVTAYITGQYMYIPYTVVLNEMQVGERKDATTGESTPLWSWRKMSNENLRLVWLGGDRQ